MSRELSRGGVESQQSPATPSPIPQILDAAVESGNPDLVQLLLARLCIELTPCLPMPNYTSTPSTGKELSVTENSSRQTMVFQPEEHSVHTSDSSSNMSCGDEREIDSTTSENSDEHHWKRAFLNKERECTQLMETITALSAALHEVNVELRETSITSNAYCETVTTISKALQESDSQLQEAALRCETLEFKLQAVTFLDKGELPSDKRQSGKYRGKQLRRRKYKRSRKTHGKQSKTGRDDDETADELVERLVEETMLDTDDEDQDDDNDDDDCDDDEDDEPAESTYEDEELLGENLGQMDELSEISRSQSPNGLSSQSSDQFSVHRPTETPSLTGPGQAAFYRVIYERDQARREVSRIRHELLQRRDQVHKLRDKLDKSTALIKLAYAEDEQDVDTKCAYTQSSSSTTNSVKVRALKRDIKKLPSLRWLRTIQSNGWKSPNGKEPLASLADVFEQEFDLAGADDNDDADMAAGVRFASSRQIEV